MALAYKLLRVRKERPGQLFPLYVFPDMEIPIGKWLPAKEGERMKDGGVKRAFGLFFRGKKGGGPNGYERKKTHTYSYKRAGRQSGQKKT